MKPRVWVFAICYNEAPVTPWFLRHYGQFAEKIIIFDESSTDGTRELIKNCPIAELRDWPHVGMNDEHFKNAVNSVYKEARGKADWVMWPDMDEFLWHPNLLEILSKTACDAVRAQGFAMISEHGFPDPSAYRAGSQLSAMRRLGYYQENYDKAIIWRPEVDVSFDYGRHGSPGAGISVDDSMDVKLLHYAFQSVVYAADRDRRRYERVHDKRYAWNYSPEHIAKKTRGTSTWAEDLLNGGHLFDVHTTSPRLEAAKKLNFGCGGFRLEGWENYDMEVDIRRPLPFESESASRIFCEHCVEHVTPQEAWNFIEECYRVLMPGGVLRLAFPDILRMLQRMTPEYVEAVAAGGWGDGTVKSAIKAAIFCHGHQGAWCLESMGVVATAVGFKVRTVDVHVSVHRHLKDVEQHWKTVGRSINEVETSVIECLKH